MTLSPSKLHTIAINYDIVIQAVAVNPPLWMTHAYHEEGLNTVGYNSFHAHTSKAITQEYILSVHSSSGLLFRTLHTTIYDIINQ